MVYTRYLKRFGRTVQHKNHYKKMNSPKQSEPVCNCRVCVADRVVDCVSYLLVVFTLYAIAQLLTHL